MTDSRVTGKKIRSLFFLALSYGQEKQKSRNVKFTNSSCWLDHTSLSQSCSHVFYMKHIMHAYTQYNCQARTIPLLPLFLQLLLETIVGITPEHGQKALFKGIHRHFLHNAPTAFSDAVVKLAAELIVATRHCSNPKLRYLCTIKHNFHQIRRQLASYLGSLQVATHKELGYEARRQLTDWGW